jgi:hypothetical protein
MTTLVECEMFVAVNYLGDYDVALTAESAVEKLNSSCGAGDGSVRIARILVTMSKPDIAEITVKVPDDLTEQQIKAAAKAAK